MKSDSYFNMYILCMYSTYIHTRPSYDNFIRDFYIENRITTLRLIDCSFFFLFSDSEGCYLLCSYYMYLHIILVMRQFSLPVTKPLTFLVILFSLRVSINLINY